MLNHPARGFTLTELALVLVIVALILGGLLVPLSAQQDIRLRRETQASFSDIREALLGFIAAKGRLPCPAIATLDASDPASGAGKEAANNIGDCTTVSGVIPWVDLGVPQTDAWNRRFTYRVTAAFAKDFTKAAVTSWGSGCNPSTAPTQSSIAMCSDGDIDVKQSGVTITKLPAIVVSHGKNGFGAYDTLGKPVDITNATDDEKTNANGGNLFVISDNGSFDDMLLWLPTNIVINRLVITGRLP